MPRLSGENLAQKERRIQELAAEAAVKLAQLEASVQTARGPARPKAARKAVISRRWTRRIGRDGC